MGNLTEDISMTGCISDILGPDLDRLCEKERLEKLERIINTPMIEDFVQSAVNEARYQIDRWDDHDAMKTPERWREILGYLSGKAVNAFENGDYEKGMHHIISSAALLANWHRHMSEKLDD